MKRAFSRRNLWNKVPGPVKANLGGLIGLLPPAVYLGKAFRRHRAFVRQAQWWSADEARAYQLDQLKAILTLAYECTGYYRRVFDEVGFRPGDFRSDADLLKLPFIDKMTLREHLEEMCAVSPKSPGVDYVSTGGTGGTPLHFYTTSRRSAIEYAYLVTSWERSGYRLETPMAVLRGRVITEQRNGRWCDYDPILRHHYYSTFHMTDEAMRSYVEHIRGIGPCYLHTYPSAAMTLVQFMRREGIQPPNNVRGILAESENMYPDQVAALQEFFGVRFFSSYGHSEKLVLAAECEHSSDYHVWPTYGFCELLDDEGRRVATPGQRGEIVGTGWINDVVPFIRYRTGDYAVYAGEGCSKCGRQHTLIRSVEGRWPAGDLVARDGSLISMTSMNVHDDTFARVQRFQFYQDTPGVAVLRVVPASGFTEDDKRQIQHSLAPKVAGRLDITIQQTDDIQLSPRGKAVYVDQKIPLADRRSGTWSS